MLWGNMIVATAFLALHLSTGIQGQTSLPKEFVETTQFLIGHGFANPKGGKFSIATIKVSNTYDGSLSEKKVRGWVMPPKPGEKPTIIVPNGLEYPVEQIVRGADVNEGLEPILEPNQYRIKGDFDQGYTGVACLLLTGNTSLAEKAYAAIPYKDLKSTFLPTATEYLANRYHRAVEAHMRGDLTVVLNDAAELNKNRKAFENEAFRIFGAKYIENRIYPIIEGKKPTVFRFLDMVDKLLVDSLRRLSEHPLKESLKDVLELPVAKRLPKLILMLDQVGSHQYSQFGGASLVADPIVSAIIESGPSAAPSLLDAVEFDGRLTRSVSFGRYSLPDQSLKSVRDAALTAFTEIAQVSQFQESGQPLDIKKVREFWAKYGAMKPADRWFSLLADDSAGPAQWFEGANSMVDQREFVNIAGIRGYRIEKTKPMHGEILRGRTNPSVTDLMAKRARMLYAATKENTSDKLNIPMRMAMLLYKWDPKAALPVLQDVSRQIMQESIRSRNNSSTFAYSGPVLALLLETRFKLGDDEALTEYCQYLLGMNHSFLNMENGEGLRLLAKYSTRSEMIDVIQKLFIDPDGPWNPSGVNSKQVYLEQFVNTPLIVLSPVRAVAKTRLADKTEAGNSWNDGQQLHTQNFQGGGSTQGIDPRINAALFPSVGETRKFRNCDVTATFICQLTGAPKFEVYWPEVERDRVIAELMVWIDTIRYKDVKRFSGGLMWERDSE